MTSVADSEFRQRVLDRSYFLSGNALDEMKHCDLERSDIEHAILNGSIEQLNDPSGTQYCIRGRARDGRDVHVMCRYFPALGPDLKIMTAYVRSDHRQVDVCNHCGSGTIEKTIQMDHWREGRLYLVENVKAEFCLSCGNRRYDAKAHDAIDELLAGEHEIRERLEVQVVRR